jgi:hypothetical protein
MTQAAIMATWREYDKELYKILLIYWWAESQSASQASLCSLESEYAD